MKDLTVEDVRRVAQGRYWRKHRGKMMITIGVWLACVSLVAFGFVTNKGHDLVWFLIFAGLLSLSVIAYVFLVIVFSYLESRFMWKFQQEWSDNNKIIPEDYRS